jgi:hypothetical protein
MPLKVMRAPKGADEALQRGIMELAAADALDADLRSVARLEPPLRVFVLDASALKMERPLDEARQVAWRYTLLDADGKPIGFAELVAGPKGRLSLAQVGGAEGARSARDALTAAETSPLARVANCEARLLRLPAAYLTAVWLAPASEKGEDVLVPVAPAPDGVEPHQSYTVADLMKAVKPTVDQQLGLKVSRQRA